MAEEIVDALVLAARYDLQGLTVGERQVLNSVDRIAQGMTKLNASGQVSPFGTIGRDLLQANAAFRRGELDLEGLNVALQQARIEMSALRDSGVEPDARALGTLTSAIDRTTAALARLNRQGGSGGRGPLGDLDQQISKVAKGGAGFDAGIARARSGLAQLAVQSLGTSSAVGQVAQSLLLIGGASVGGIIAAALVVAALAKGFELMTASAKKATEAREKLTTALNERISGALPEGSQISQEIAAAEEAQALAGREIANINKDIAASEFTIFGVKQKFLFALADEIRLRSVTAAQTAAQRAEAEGLVLLALRTAAAGAQATESTLAAQTEIRRQVEASASAAAEFSRSMSALGHQTFGAQPGFVSQQETQAFAEQIRLAKDRTAQDIKDLEIRQAAAKVKPLIEDNAQRITRQGLIASIGLEIQARQLVGAEQVKAIRREQELLEATREATRAEEDHQRRVQQAGGGNTLGANPALQSSTITLPTPQDVERLRQQLQVIPPVGLPSPDDIARAWKEGLDEARRQNLAPILQGARQSGAEAALPASETAANHRAAEEAKALGEALGRAHDEMTALITGSLDLGNGLSKAASGVADVGTNLRALKQAKKDFADAADEAGKLAARVDELSAMQGILQGATAAAFGLIDALAGADDQTAAVAKSLVGLGASLATGNIAGAITSGIGLISAAFGPSEDDRIREENNRLLKDNTGALERFKGPTGLTDLGAVADVGRRVSQGGRGEFGFLQALDQAGISLEAFAKIARDSTGIQIIDKQGHLVAGSLEQLQKAVDLAREAAFRFGTDIESQRAKADAEARIFRDPNATQDQLKTAALDRERTLQLNAVQLSDAEEAFVRSLNLGTKEGRDAFRKWEQDVARRILSGEITPDQLKGFASAQDALNELADTTDLLNESMSAAAKSMQNFPDTFKLAAAEWQARASDISPVVPTPTHLRGTDFNPKIPGGTDGSMLPNTQVTGNTIIIQLPALPKNATLADQARAVADEFEARSIATFGLAPPP